MNNLRQIGLATSYLLRHAVQGRFVLKALVARMTVAWVHIKLYAYIVLSRFILYWAMVLILLRSCKRVQEQMIVSFSICVYIFICDGE